MRRASYIQAIEFFLKYTPHGVGDGLDASDLLRRFIVYLFDITEAKFSADVTYYSRKIALSSKKD